MSISDLFKWNVVTVEDTELPDIFPLSINKVDFIKTDVMTIYSKILTDVLERTHGLSDEQMDVMWDNCIASEAGDGLITRLAKAMTDKRDLFLVYDKSLKVLVEAKTDVAEQIRKDYKTKGQSDLGVYVSFKNYSRTDMVSLYSGLEFCSVASLNKSMNVSGSIQFKVSKLRGDIATTDSAAAISQAKTVARTMGQGRDVLIDGDDVIETSKPDLTSTEKSFALIDNKRSLYLGLPAAYINGLLTGGIGSTGEADTKAIERGLKSYFHSVMKPVLKALFSITPRYKSQDTRQIDQGLEAMKTFELTSDDLMNRDNKVRVINQLFDLDEDNGNESAG